jgi:hypothetical protein
MPPLGDRRGRGLLLVIANRSVHSSASDQKSWWRSCPRPYPHPAWHTQAQRFVKQRMSRPSRSVRLSHRRALAVPSALPKSSWMDSIHTIRSPPQSRGRGSAGGGSSAFGQPFAESEVLGLCPNHPVASASPTLVQVCGTPGTSGQASTESSMAHGDPTIKGGCVGAGGMISIHNRTENEPHGTRIAQITAAFVRRQVCDTPRTRPTLAAQTPQASTLLGFAA